MRKHQLNLPGIGRPLNLRSLARSALRDRQARENELAVYSKLAENTQFSVPNLMIVMKLRSDAERFEQLHVPPQEPPPRGPPLQSDHVLLAMSV
jgi:hypothetical protein